MGWPLLKGKKVEEKSTLQGNVRQSDFNEQTLQIVTNGQKQRLHLQKRKSREK